MLLVAVNARTRGGLCVLTWRETFRFHEVTGKPNVEGRDVERLHVVRYRAVSLCHDSQTLGISEVRESDLASQSAECSVVRHSSGKGCKQSQHGA